MSQALITFNTKSDPYLLVWSVCLSVPCTWTIRGHTECHTYTHTRAHTQAEGYTFFHSSAFKIL